MRRPEQRLWDRARDKLTGAGLFVERIENVVTQGMPDFVCIAPGGVVTFVELKAVTELPKRDTTPLLGARRGLNREQRAWHRRWMAYGGRSTILVGVSAAKVLLVWGRHADDINDWPLARMEAYASASNWEAVSSFLRTRYEWLEGVR